MKRFRADLQDSIAIAVTLGTEGQQYVANGMAATSWLVGFWWWIRGIPYADYQDPAEMLRVAREWNLRDRP